MSSFDTLLDTKIGALGKWQVYLFILIMIPSDIPTAMIPQLVNLSPNFVCGAAWFPVERGWTYGTVLNISRIVTELQLPGNHSGGSVDLKCHRYDFSGLPVSLRNQSLTEQQRTILHFAARVNLSLQSCPGPWFYDAASAPYRRSLIEEFDLVCDRGGLIPNSAATFVLGMMFGVLIGGQLGDHFGRRPIMCCMYPLHALVSMLMPLCSNVFVFFAMRTLMGFLHSMAYCCGYVYFLEITNYRHRNTLCVIDGLVYYLLGQSFVILGNFLLQDWRWVHVACGSVILLFSILVALFLPESPRWLIAQGRIQEALKVLRRSAFINKGYPVPLTEEDISGLAIASAVEGHKAKKRLRQKILTPLTDWRAFFVSRKTFKHLLPLVCIWFVVACVFYGISFYAVRLSGNPYLVAFLMTLTCIPTKLLQLLLYEKLNRKAPLVGLLAISCFFCAISFISMVTLGTSAFLTVAAATLSLSGLTTIFDMIFLVTSEMFSTLHRNKALGFLSSCSRLGIVVGMFVERLERAWHATPLLLFSIFLTAAVVNSAFLPTKNYDTMGDVAKAKEDIKASNGVNEVKESVALNTPTHNDC